MKSDNFIENIIQNFQMLNKITPNKLLAIKDADFRYVYVTDGYANIYGLSHKDMVGKTDPEIKNNSNTNSQNKEEEQILKNNATEYYLDISQIKNKQTPMIMSKAPIIDPITSIVQGILIECHNMNVFSVSRNICRKFDNHRPIPTIKKAIKLTGREQQIVFLFLANFNSQEIANIIQHAENKSITKNTVDSVFKGLFVKFDCTNRIELHRLLLLHHFDRLIPNNLLPECTIKLSHLFNGTFI